MTDQEIKTERATPRWTLHWEGRVLVIGDGPVVVGRSPSCALTVEDALVSRQHFSLQRIAGALFVEDLRSANGVFVNGERVRQPRRLHDGDRVLVGHHELRIQCADELDGEFVPSEATTLDAMPQLGGEAAAQQAALLAATSESTKKADMFRILGDLADGLLREGHADTAARVLAELMHDVLERLRSGEELPEDVLASAIEYSLRLARASREGCWIDYVVDLHLTARRPMSRDVVNQVAPLLNDKVSIDNELFERYQEFLREILPFAKGDERKLVEALIRYRQS